ncbi:Putative addiction module component [Anatilimnocola aggregata]|uniref:Addiction module component n=1 Tax=Anatilimnocola aggregata TaxID=2528021 RepID=A0A517Y5W0_9BACT|nr:addiction module protein [Anatilimnocola aggregata]QDU25512.1 Putative addiction module component [Anatilimnocola aggregata]
MTINLADFGIDRLNRDERMELAIAILRSVAESPDVPVLSDALKAELNRRMDAYERDPGKVLGWEDVRAEIYASLQK